jgi:hypothetical protein
MLALCFPGRKEGLTVTFTAPAPTNEWNLFAVVLKQILAAHGATLDMLDDIPRLESATPTYEELKAVQKQRIAPEIVRRLKRSLEADNSFTTLSVRNIQKVVKNFGLKLPEEERWLRAAVLATAVQQQLHGRIGPAAARAAAWEVLQIIYDALRDHDDRQDGSGLGATKGKPSGGITMTALDTPFDRALEATLEGIESALLDLFLSETTESPAERARYAQQAYDGFSAALTVLEGADASLRGEAWDAWHEAAEQGKADAARNLTQRR